MLHMPPPPPLPPGPLPSASTEAPDAAAQAPDAADRIEARCLEHLWGLHEQHGFPGGSAALVLPDGTEIGLPFGYADLEAEREMDTAHLLLSGSVGKTYVSAAFLHMMLVTHPGQVAFDQPIAEHLGQEPWFERLPNARTATVGQLLRHESGIGRYVFKPEFFATCLAQPDRVWTPEQLLAYVLDDEPLFAAGEGWGYSDTNYIVAGMILERVTGTPFYDYVDEHLLTPLGLEATRPSDRRELLGLAQGYAVVTRAMGMPERMLVDGRFCYNPQFEWCGGGFASSPLDLARWAHLLYRGEAFDAPYLEPLLEGVPAALGPGVEYGRGVMLRPTPLGLMQGHDGFMTGYVTTMGYFPEHGISVALMLNTDDGSVLGAPLPSVATELVHMALEELRRQR